jgi:pantoate--beta-alanine ligase
MITGVQVIAKITELRERLSAVRKTGASIGFVPTMGALHAGHAALLKRARSENDFVVASIFVNPLQFDRKADLETYPRTMDADLETCTACGTDLIFAPGVTDLYPAEQLTFVYVPALSENLCGASRPGHFRGVATVVLKLFNVVQADRAYFGEKDAQQLAVIRRMVQDLNVPVEVVPVATVREADGLALSSRNKHLSAAQRENAPVLARAMRTALGRFASGEKSVAEVTARVLPMFSEVPECRLEYFEVVDPATLRPVERAENSVLVIGALWMGTTRLIDNMLFSSAARTS